MFLKLHFNLEQEHGKIQGYGRIDLFHICHLPSFRVCVSIGRFEHSLWRWTPSFSTTFYSRIWKVSGIPKIGNQVKRYFLRLLGLGANSNYQSVAHPKLLGIWLCKEDPFVRKQVAKVQWALRALSSRVWLLTRQLRRKDGHRWRMTSRLKVQKCIWKLKKWSYM